MLLVGIARILHFVLKRVVNILVAIAVAQGIAIDAVELENVYRFLESLISPVVSTADLECQKH